MTVEAPSAARAFVRSLNALLKYARLYGFEHSRVLIQFESAWKELHAALIAPNSRGVLLGIAGSQLLLDGVPLETTPAERSFAELLTMAGIASIQFDPGMTRDQFSHFSRAFSVGGTRMANPEQLKAMLARARESGVRMNEIRFVADDGSMSDARVAMELTARTLGANSEEWQSFVNDPQKLIHLLAAASDQGGGAANPGGTLFGSRTGSGSGTGIGSGSGTGKGIWSGTGGGLGGGIGSGGTGGSSGSGGTGRGGGAGTGVGGSSGPGRGAGSGAGSGTGTGAGTGAGSGVGSGPGTGSGIGTHSEYGPLSSTAQAIQYEVAGLPEEDVIGILQLLVQLGEASKGKSQSVDSAIWQQNVARLPEPARVTLGEALASVAAAAPLAKPGENVLVKLAEDLAIRFALERYQRGDIKVNAVRQLLDRMGREVESLRRMLQSREEKLASAGLPVESHADLLDRQFWASVPEAGKRGVLLSPEAWCIPPRNVRQYAEELLDRNDSVTAHSILLQYTKCIRSSDVEARRKAATGLTQLVEVYSRAAASPMVAAIREIGEQLAVEKDAEVQTLLGAAFVRFSQEAVARRQYPVMLQALDSLGLLEKARSSSAPGLRSRFGVENRLHEFIDEGLGSEQFPAGFVDLLRRLPETAAEQLAARLPLCDLRSERERLIELAKQAGEPSTVHLRKMLHGEWPSKAVAVVGLLSRLDSMEVATELPNLLPTWNRGLQEQALRQLATAGAPERGRMLVNLIDVFDPLVRPLVVDEIGLAGDGAVTELLLRLAAQESDTPGNAYQSLKAVEALGRLGDRSAAKLLHEIVEKKRAWRPVHRAEMRMAAAGSLSTVDPAWTRNDLAAAGLDGPELAMGPKFGIFDETAVRQRRYPRVRLEKPVPVVVTSARGKFSLEARSLNLGGGLLHGEHHLAAGTDATIKIQFGLRSVTAQVILRVVRAQNTIFEIVGMDLEERTKFRRQLAALSAAANVTQ